MNSASHGLESEQTVSEYATRYELLRGHSGQCRTPMSRHGLAVLLTQGVASWMRAWSKMPASLPRSREDEKARPCPLPSESGAEVIHVLAAMALGQIQEEVFA